MQERRVINGSLNSEQVALFQNAIELAHMDSRSDLVLYLFGF